MHIDYYFYDGKLFSFTILEYHDSISIREYFMIIFVTWQATEILIPK